MSRPTVSVILPAYNAERYIAEALDSIFAQTYGALDVTVIDDGSTDRTAEIVRDYPRDMAIVDGGDAGPAAARTLGVRSTAGPLVAFLDPDDLWHPDKLTRQVACLDADPELMYCVTHAQMVWVDELARERDALADNPRTRPIPGYATTTLLARRQVFDRVGCFDAGRWFTDATDWFVRAREAGVPGRLLDDVLVYHRMHAHNLTRRRSDDSRDEFLDMLKASLDRRRASDR